MERVLRLKSVFSRVAEAGIVTGVIPVAKNISIIILGSERSTGSRRYAFDAYNREIL